ncbi:hypothetical protein RIF29_13838 [Crotalaria pallida]|uniref:Uncharacterized protein n=1 Tax=Crotalaria pallida TaxID=3830 RepID=A0AAN9I9S0_CROPI
MLFLAWGLLILTSFFEYLVDREIEQPAAGGVISSRVNNDIDIEEQPPPPPPPPLPLPLPLPPELTRVQFQRVRAERVQPYRPTPSIRFDALLVNVLLVNVLSVNVLFAWKNSIMEKRFNHLECVFTSFIPLAF